MNDMTTNSTLGVNTRKQSYYELLGVSQDATSTNIREAYFRLKNTYTQTNQALYSLVDHSEIDEISKQVEQAYEVLVNTHSRLEYNRTHGFESNLEEDQIGDEFHRVGATASDVGERFRNFREENLSKRRIRSEEFSTAYKPKPMKSNKLSFDRIKKHVSVDDLGQYESEISDLALDSDWSGDLFIKLRGVSGATQEEIQYHTKISLGFIKSLESDSFAQMPQESYLKGFLSSYLGYLRVPKKDTIIESYLGKYRDWKSQQSN